MPDRKEESVKAVARPVKTISEIEEVTGRRRVVIRAVRPQVDCGRFPVKRIVGDRFQVTADIFCDGHDNLYAELLYRKADAIADWETPDLLEESQPRWQQTPMTLQVNDLWAGEFQVTKMGPYLFTIRAWIDRFKSWQTDLRKRLDAGQNVDSELPVAVSIIRNILERVEGRDRAQLEEFIHFLDGKNPKKMKIQLALDEGIASIAARHPDSERVTQFSRELPLWVDREKARFSTWYEFFPRSAGKGLAHGTFNDCVGRLSRIRRMGFDIVYFPPIHPIGLTHRKGKNNAVVALPDDWGSPWAIGSREGGHKSIHPKLGTLEDFRRFVKEASKKDIEVALDIAFQCSPDHPYVREHPEWFVKRPDGSIQYAENPPKKYQDIYPLNFECEEWRSLWKELYSVFDFWIRQGVRIFRVDNPHTKPFAFWEWTIKKIHDTYPDVIFLSEAFTRPKVMQELAKLGFTQSYTYFAWRNSKWELIEYFSELTQTEVAEYFRPNAWPNTPDILTEYLQGGGRPAFIVRLILAATLSANYGIYGPAFEMMVNQAQQPGSEEYLDSEKYEIRDWDLDNEENLDHLITRVNKIRRENPALHQNRTLRFHSCDNDNLICYSKQVKDNLIITVVNLDPHHTHSGWVDLPLEELGINSNQNYQVHDLISEGRYFWRGSHNYVELNPHIIPAHIFRVRHQLRTEEDFEYFF